VKTETRYSPEVRERAVRMVLDQQNQHESQRAAIVSIAAKIGCKSQTLQGWVRQHEHDHGIREGLTTAEHELGAQTVDEHFVRSEQVRLLYRNAPTALLVNMLNAALLVVAVADMADFRLFLWLAALAAVTLGRGMLVRAYRDSVTAPRDPDLWARRYVVGAAMAGTLWGAAGVLIAIDGTMVQQAFAAFILGGMSAGAIATSASVMAAYLTFVLPALLPIALLFLVQGDRLHLVMGVMGLVFIGALLVTGRHAGRLLHSTLALQMHNARINAELKRHRENLEQLVADRTAKLAAANQALTEHDRRKDEFLALLGHELRNPLAAICTASELLTRGQPDRDPDVGWASALIARQTARLARLVDDLLDVARISHGRIQLRCKPIDLTSALSDAIEAARPLIDGRGHHLEVDLPGQPVGLLADRVRIAQVVENLLINAAKYTPAGGEIRLEASRDGDEVAIRVSDTGTGIAPEHLEHIFDPFEQGEGASEGLGLGLALVRDLVSLHGGSVTASSPGLGSGSEFVVRLPALVDAPVQPPEPSRSELENQTHGRVLVVDDNVDAADSLAALLRLMGRDARAAYDGESALAAIGEFRPELAILDLGMPGMNGYELAARLRECYAAGDLRLVALSGHAQTQDAARAAGFDLHLLKPASADDLRKALEG
jgi:signal transduction histidine kinase/CheY-like chemotaxis protein